METDNSYVLSTINYKLDQILKVLVSQAIYPDKLPIEQRRLLNPVTLAGNPFEDDDRSK